ncbi:hypothetical protein M8J77_000147 [Diaphorina citri]|nr:hypothetical protein M8J77_000147 [Diaphorina citri]
MTSNKQISTSELLDMMMEKLLNCDTYFQKISTIVDNCMQNKVKNLEEKVGNLEIENTILKNKLNDLEQYGKRSNLRVFGLNKVNINGQSVEEKVINLFKGKLNVNVEKNDIEACHYTNSKKKECVIVRFLSRKTRDEVFSNKKKLKNSPVNVAEDLTVDNYKLMRKCKELYNKKNVWTHYGAIKILHAGKITTIQNMQELEALQLGQPQFSSADSFSTRT